MHLGPSRYRNLRPAILCMVLWLRGYYLFFLGYLLLGSFFASCSLECHLLIRKRIKWKKTHFLQADFTIYSLFLISWIANRAWWISIASVWRKLAHMRATSRAIFVCLRLRSLAHRITLSGQRRSDKNLLALTVYRRNYIILTQFDTVEHYVREHRDGKVLSSEQRLRKRADWQRQSRHLLLLHVCMNLSWHATVSVCVEFL